MSDALVECPNCARAGVARFCPHCGQNYRDYRRSLPPMLLELLREAFEVDGRILQSLKLLFLKPGQLTVEFSANRRASFVSPIRLYLFASILFFFVLAQVAEFDVSRVPDQSATVESEEAFSEDSIEYLQSLLTAEQAQKMQAIVDSERAIARAVVVEMANSAFDEVAAGGTHGTIEAFLFGELIEVLDDPRDFFERSFENLPFAMFFLLPVYAGLLMLVFLGSHRYFVEHLVYALHLHTFAFLLLTLQLLLPEGPGPFLALWFFAYYLVSLRRYYGQGRARTALKFVLLVGAYGLLAVPAILATMLVTATLV